MSREDARMSMTLNPELKRRFKAVADANKRSMIQEMTIAITEHVEAFERGGVNREMNGSSEISSEERKKELELMIKQVLRESGYEVNE